MKYLIVLLTLFGILFSGCAKKACERDNRGWVAVTNLKEDPYELKVNDGFVTNIPAGGTYSYEGTGGETYEFKLTQNSGYLLFPSVYTEDFHIVQCETKYWTKNK